MLRNNGWGEQGAGNGIPDDTESDEKRMVPPENSMISTKIFDHGPPEITRPASSSCLAYAIVKLIPVPVPFTDDFLSVSSYPFSGIACVGIVLLYVAFPSPLSASCRHRHGGKYFHPGLHWYGYRMSSIGIAFRRMRAHEAQTLRAYSTTANCIPSKVRNRDLLLTGVLDSFNLPLNPAGSPTLWAQ